MLNYSQLRSKIKNELRTTEWETDLLTILATMFEYHDVPDVDTRYIEIYLLLFGECAIWKPDGDKYAVTYCNRAGTPNVNGEGKDLICTTFNGISKTFNDFEDSPDVVYIRNDILALPDVQYQITADYLGEIAKSFTHVVRNSRYKPIVLCSSDQTKRALETAVKDNGETSVVMSDNVLIEGEHGVDVINITDVNASDKIQYLTKAHDDCLRQFFNMYGQYSRGINKMAQQTTSEINDGADSSMIIPEDRLNCRKKGIDECNRKFGWSASVEFSGAWARELGKVLTQLDSDFVNENGGEENEEKLPDEQSVDESNKD